jgi:large subunit ribosomal protein L19
MQFSPVKTEERKKINLRAGDTVRVWQKIQEKGKTRLQAFEGLVIARKHGKEPGATFTVRKILHNVGVERIFPLYSSVIDKIEVVRRAKVRRAKLYYIREKTSKQIRRKMKGLAEFVPVSYEEKSDEEPETEDVVTAEEGSDKQKEAPKEEMTPAEKQEEEKDAKEKLEVKKEANKKETKEKTEK